MDRPTLRPTLWTTLALLAALAAGPVAADDPVLTIHCDTPGHAISPRLYGIFFEEINHAGDGGLYAELIRNRTFEEPADQSRMIPGWSLLPSPGAKATMTLDKADPFGPDTGQYARLDIEQGGAAIASKGYWGIPVHTGLYKLRFDLLADEPLRQDIRITLEPPDGNPIAMATIGPIAGGWQRLEVDLHANSDHPDARLVISFEGPGTALIDTVSLVPADTWKGRRFGMRKDLGDLVEGLHPAFVRFPGGCYVEGGDLLKDAFKWSSTVRDIADRPGHANATWGYWSSDGLGFHEYLQWCEDLKAEALFVANCGMSHKEVVPLDQLDPWIQETLDAIEYATGATDTTWGARRAANGHPAPFNLRYIEIGNENGMFGGFGGTTDQYTQRYTRFYDAIKARHPEILTIADTGVAAPLEIVDDHYYNSPAWFWSNIGLYDTTDRTGPRVYVGEYAVTQGCGTGNLAAALAEAAFMTGLERNSDVVTMSSYAPMFVHVADRKWNPDMIVFDGRRSHGTPSYHVQTLFAANRPDTLLPIDAPKVAAAPSITKGGIGLGTWFTQAEFKDITVEKAGAEARIVYSSNFATGTDGWKIGAGDWKVVEGAYRQSAQAEKQFALLDLPALRDATDYTIRLKARKLGGDEGFLILFRAPDTDNYSWWNIGGWGNREHAVEKCTAGMKFGVGGHARGSVETDRWYDVMIELAGKNIRCSLDGKVIQSVEEKSMPSFAAVAGRIDATGEIIVKVVNGSDLPMTTRLSLPGAGPLDPTGQSTVLTSAALTDENSLDHPTRIAPTTATITGVAEGFTHEFPARSLTILRLKSRK